MLNLEVRDERLLDIIDPQQSLVQVATGFDFLEGPVWHPTYQSVIFSDIMGNSLYSWTESDGVAQRRRNSYMANGNAYDRAGRLITCEHATSRVTRTNLATGSYETIADTFQGLQLNSPNDVVVKSDGTIYFTDPLSGRSAGYGVPREPSQPKNGVYRLDPVRNKLTLLVDDFSKPNGLCFSQDERLLYVNDTDRQHIRVFTMLDDGGVDFGRIWATTTGEGTGVPDGMKVDSQDNVYSCGPGGIHVFDKGGMSLGVINIPEHTANFVFGDADLQALYVTASTSLYRLRTKVAGVLTYDPANS